MTVDTRYSENKKSDKFDYINDESFIVCWGFMRRDLKLEKTELMIYAIIYGFYRSGEMFDGTISYLSEWSGSGKSAVRAALASLLAKGYITKKVTRYKNCDFNEYGINIDALPRIQMHERVHELNEEYNAECMKEKAQREA